MSDCVVSCQICPANDLSLCGRMRPADAEVDWIAETMPLASSTQLIPARRTICHPKEWSEFVPVICRGWAASSITLLDGRRQILSFLLPGDLVSTASLVEPMSGRTVEAITDVTCRKFSRTELKTYLFQRPNLLEKLSKTWVEERTQADQLALPVEHLAPVALDVGGQRDRLGLDAGQRAEERNPASPVADSFG